MQVVGTIDTHNPVGHYLEVTILPKFQNFFEFLKGTTEFVVLLYALKFFYGSLKFSRIIDKKKFEFISRYLISPYLIFE